MTDPLSGIQGVDIFCGCGGMTRGLLDAGIAIKLGVDLDHTARKTYESNNHPAHFLNCDVKDLTGKEIQYYSGIGPDDHLLLAGCAPCQPFSRLHKGRVDTRSRLVTEFARLVNELMPDAVILENVPALDERHLSRWKQFKATLERLGYVYEVKVYDAKNYGVPQRRRRLVLIAGRGFCIQPPRPTHGPKGSLSKKYLTVRDAIGLFPPIEAGQTHGSVSNHRAAGLSPHNLRRIKAVKKDGGSRDGWPIELVLKCHKYRNGRIDKRHHTDTYGRMSWDSPAPTLTTKCTSLTNGRYGHPLQDRAISVREAAALQTFPQWYVFPDLMTRPTLWIGNAVPPVLACAIGRAAVQAILSNKTRRRNAMAVAQDPSRLVAPSISWPL